MSHDFNTLLSDIKLPSHLALASHWLDLHAAADGALPAVSAIDPLALGKYLPDICILSHEGGNDFRFRIAGGNVNDFYGRDIKRVLLADLVESPTRERLFDMAHQILQPPSILLHGLSSMLPQWNYSIALRRISLPLADEAGQPSHIISSTVYFRHSRDEIQSLVNAEFQQRYLVPAPADYRAGREADRRTARPAR